MNIFSQQFPLKKNRSPKIGGQRIAQGKAALIGATHLSVRRIQWELLTFSLFLTLLLFGSTTLFAEVPPFSLQPAQNNQRTKSFQVYLGPQIYHVLRKKEGGSRQSGEVYAIRGGYERIKRSKLYIGFDALYGSGVLRGKSGSQDHLKSNFTDTYAEGRVGYTFQSKKKTRLRLTPYLGLGFFVEKNHYTHPKEMPVHFRISYFYPACGILSEIKMTEQLFLGLNGEIRYPYDPKCRVSNDPNNRDWNQIFKEEIQYRIELPISYRFFDSECSLKPFFVQLVPFYEKRQYGYHPNYPFDFLKTKLNVYGAFLKLVYGL